MKIFSNFDTEIRKNTIEQHSIKYWRENILCFGRSRLYFYVKIFFPFVFVLLLASWAIIGLYFLFEGDYLWIVSLLVFLVSLIFLLPVIGKRIDYKLDFIIVTPDYLIMYDQNWIFSKKVITLNEKSIKTISVERPGLLYSIFNNGDIIFLAEGDVTDHGDVKLKWIPKPEKRRNQIAKIMHKDI